MVRMYSNFYQDDDNGNLLENNVLFVRAEDYLEFRHEFYMAKFHGFSQYGNEIWITSNGYKITLM